MLKVNCTPLLTIIKANVAKKRMEECIDIFRISLNVSQKEYEGDEDEKVFTSFKSASDTIMEKYRTEAYDICFDSLYEQDIELSKLIGKELDFDDIVSLLDETIIRIETILSENEVSEEDNLFFLQILQEVANVTPNESDEVLKCPYCDGTPEIISANDFFGEDSRYDGKQVCCCECGAFAILDKNGNIIGTMANKELHEKRSRLRSVLHKYCEVSASTMYEAKIKVLSNLDRKVPYKNAIERLTLEECNSLIHKVLVAIKKIEELNVRYPKNHKELMTCLKNGGRMKIIKEISQKNNGRILIPLEVGESTFTIKSRTGIENILMPSSLAYTFEGRKIKISHPSGLIDEYLIFPEEIRTIPV